MTIEQGDIFWFDFGIASGSAPGYRHPCVVVQNNLFNQSLIRTVVICLITSNLKRAKAPGNILLSRGEANLKTASVVNISQILTVDKSDLKEKIGSLSPHRFEKVIEGIKLLIEPKNI